MKIIIFFCLIFYLNFNLVNADNLDLPKEMQKTWAVPDCASVEEVYFYTNHFELKVNSQAISLKPALHQEKQAEYNIINIKGNNYYNHITNDGIMQIGYNLKQDADEWDDMDFKHLSEYMHCSNLSEEYNKEKKAISFIRKIENTCLDDANKDCNNSSFKAIDKNKDQKISKYEFKDALKTILYLSYASDTDNEIEKPAIYFAIDNTDNKIDELNKLIFKDNKFIKKKNFKNIRNILDKNKPESNLFLSGLNRLSNSIPGYRP